MRAEVPRRTCEREICLPGRKASESPIRRLEGVGDRLVFVLEQAAGRVDQPPSRAHEDRRLGLGVAYPAVLGHGEVAREVQSDAGKGAHLDEVPAIHAVTVFMSSHDFLI